MWHGSNNRTRVVRTRPPRHSPRASSPSYASPSAAHMCVGGVHRESSDNDDDHDERRRLQRQRHGQQVSDVTMHLGLSSSDNCRPDNSSLADHIPFASSISMFNW
eukprot:TRINITY_DN5122_c0_g1_i1.p3 TRINITY_DN5122_c0_g1~~TRINITY_DN5122_c0_g1_i1.p3  ORF type:complete len:105 (+),score=13.64 TRINITY_DN5122_c0_g1_i1:580-894(+)